MGEREDSADKALVEALTRREHEVLGLLAKGFSAPEIAGQLTLALSTVKFHLDNLYGKLGANSKRQALNRARVLGLLPPAGAGAATGQPAAPAIPRHNLPLQVTRFFGREEEIAHIRERLAEQRLVTLTGVGGVGKTRLALRAAEGMLEAYANGAWAVELAPLSDPGLVPQHVAAALGLPDRPGRPVLETLVAHLRTRQVLLLLDNCEHLLDACAGLAEALLAACPQLTVLATSREPLNVAGEAVFAVRPLPIPEAGRPASPPDLDRYAAVRLFCDRARLVLPDYAVAAHNAAAIAVICQRLDGLPLALELAAARISTLSTEQLAGRLDDAFAVLTQGRRAALPRHQTLRATIDWSYALLTEPERVLLQRLSGFAGGCTLEAAEAVCAGDGLDRAQVLDHLASLVAKSMVVAHRPPGQPARYSLLEMVRQYAAEKLDEAGQTAAVRTRHLDYYMAYARVNNELWGHTQEPGSHLANLHREFDNMRRALDWAFSGAAEVETGPRLALMLYDRWRVHQEGLDTYLRAAAWCRSHSGVSAALYANVLGVTSTYLALNDPPSAFEFAVESAAVSRTLTPEASMFHLDALRFAGWMSLWVLPDLERARAYYAEAEAYFEAHGRQHLPVLRYEFWRAWFHTSRANLHLVAGEYEAAKQAALEAMRLFDAAGFRYEFPLADAHNYCGMACVRLGEYDEAHAYFHEAIRICEAGGPQDGRSRNQLSLRWIGETYLRQGQAQRAIEVCQESIRLCTEVPDYNIIASNLGVLALVAAHLGQAERAATLSGASQAMYTRQKRQPWEDVSLEALLPGWQARPDAEALQAGFHAGQGMTNDQAVAYALEDFPMTDLQRISR